MLQHPYTKLTETKSSKVSSCFSQIVLFCATVHVLKHLCFLAFEFPLRRLLLQPECLSPRHFQFPNRAQSSNCSDKTIGDILHIQICLCSYQLPDDVLTSLDRPIAARRNDWLRLIRSLYPPKDDSAARLPKRLSELFESQILQRLPKSNVSSTTFVQYLSSRLLITPSSGSRVASIQS